MAIYLAINYLIYLSRTAHTHLHSILIEYTSTFCKSTTKSNYIPKIHYSAQQPTKYSCVFYSSYFFFIDNDDAIQETKLQPQD